MATDSRTSSAGGGAGAAFDPYYRWLGIPLAEQPPNHYRLLGLALFEADAEVIALAAERQISHIRRFQKGEHSAVSQKLLNELTAAELCLNQPAKKADYDAALKAQQAPPLRTPQPIAPALNPTLPQQTTPPQQTTQPPHPTQPFSWSSPPAKGATTAPAPRSPAGPVLPPGAYPMAMPPSLDPSPPRITPEQSAPPSYAWPHRQPPVNPTPSYPSTATPPAYAPQALAPEPPVSSSAPPEQYRAQASNLVIAQPTLPATAPTDPPPLPTRPVSTFVLTHRQILIGAAVAGLFIVIAVFSARSWFDEPIANPHPKPIVRGDHRNPTDDPAPPKGPPNEKKPAKDKRNGNLDHGNQGQGNNNHSGDDAAVATTINALDRGTQPKPPLDKTPPDQPTEKLLTEKPVPSPAPKDDPIPDTPVPPPVKPAVPSSAEQIAVQTLLESEWSADFTAAKTDDLRAALVDKLLSAADSINDDAKKRYVLLDKARQFAIAAGRLRLALAVVGRISTDFDSPALAGRINVLEELSRRTLSLTAEVNRDLAESCVATAEEAVAARQFEPVTPLLNNALAAARKTGQNEFIKQISGRVKELQDFRAKYAKFDQALKTLSDQPADPAANRLVADHYCFEERDWNRGLTYLAQADDEALRELAKLDLDRPESPDDQIEMADRWYDCKVGADGDFLSPYRIRALYWYRLGLANATGLVKQKLDKRIRDLEKGSGVNAPPVARGFYNAAEARELRRRWAQFIKGAPTKTNSLNMTLVLLPAGEFQMGAGSSDPAAQADEQPPHTVIITRPFYLASQEVTVAQFQAFVAATAYKTSAENGQGRAFYPLRDAEQDRALKDWIRDWEQKMGQRMPGGRGRTFLTWRNLPYQQQSTSPVVNVSQSDALAFCKWLGERDHAKYRLPTEAEWEFACRAGTNTPYAGADKPDDAVRLGNVADAAAKRVFPGLTSAAKTTDGFAYSAPVGRFSVNNFDLYDMHGNVAEWCADRYDETYYAKSPAENPTGSAKGDERVIRGGSWADYPADCRATSRAHAPSNDHGPHVGFRILCEP